MADPDFQDIKDIPLTHRAAISDHVGDYPTIRSVPTPQASSLRPGEALVRVAYAGVCHTDVSITMGKGTDLPIEPIIGGHEGAGYIVALGEQLGPGKGLKLGDRVGIKFMADSCLTCDECLDGAEESCADLAVNGTTQAGCFQEYIVSRNVHLTPIPDDVSLAEAAPILCAGLTTYKGLLNAGLREGDWVVIPGAGGGLGHLAVQYAIAMNYRVVGIDTGEEKKKLLEGYGCHKFVDFAEEKDIPQAVEAAIGGKAKAAIVATGVIQPYQQALKYLGMRSTLVCIGLPHNGLFEIDACQLVITSSRIVGSSLSNRIEAKRALTFVSMGKVRPNIEIREFDELADVYKELESGRAKGRVVVKLF
ncbi:uncharacterized protein I303_104301 [Kwoniella dejecticola CBS 10117]|uniref:alcohol dehydrogenase n=1 Tax=Kwoniella dejecticola CBS 10117 TaxID=1296121 RepID=A0A1A6A5R4_9TREE|nr:uncharacterized protein I303_04724 [Kwoniella dejecticola CBS 10117]OBR85389.1 hypothetical protein I303_04724 [Kwoniella dejecticola CBS 10117]